MPPLPATKSAAAKRFLQLHHLLSSIPKLPSRNITPSAEIANKFIRRFSAIPQTINHPSELNRRQSTTVDIPATYDLDPGPGAGAIVGIVLGSLVGFLLLCWLIYAVVGAANRRSVVYEEDIVHRSRTSAHSRSPRARSHRHSHAHSSRSEMRDISVSRSPTRPRREARTRETVIIDETRRPPPPREREENVIEVIEEHSPERPRRAARTSHRNSGFRDVDPDAYAGGNKPQRKEDLIIIHVSWTYTTESEDHEGLNVRYRRLRILGWNDMDEWEWY
ncbi:MAG: hypothetical protein M1834_000895 [Cirrosporium novae-zelandiae]|nr:MAG: hypothetical protein M1834_000895 [Cirrosporium novae-zelandiae]